jgi:hypothetical protein
MLIGMYFDIPFHPPPVLLIVGEECEMGASPVLAARKKFPVPRVRIMQHHTTLASGIDVGCLCNRSEAGEVQPLV